MLNFRDGYVRRFKVVPMAAAVAVMLSFSSLSHAAVTGECGSCHTMHNSQDGETMAVGGSNVGWGDVNDAGTPDMEGDSQETPHQNLLIAGCVGCHSAVTDDTIVTVGSNDIPIVFNTTGYPSEPLAGGNFYHVSQGAAFDGYGHNVYGISNPDEVLDEAPGSGIGTCGGSVSCHASLAASPAEMADAGVNNSNGKGGCQGCHYEVFHHVDNNNYRFLNGHGDERHVEGIESSDWEQNPVSTNNNKYKGATLAGSLRTNKSMSSYCGGCHANFHAMDADGVGTTDVWLRHPTDTLLPTEGEYAAYDPTATYSNFAPVSWVDPSVPARSEAVVMCLSCHRPHGSDQPDMLRWSYDACATGTGSAADCGCFVCHTEKDGIEIE